MGEGEKGQDLKGAMTMWIGIMGRLRFEFTFIEDDGKW
jgi:hypothetical protein